MQHRNTMVTVQGLVIRGFEGFEISSDECTTDNRVGAAIWLEFPGDNDRPYADGPTDAAFLKVLRSPPAELDSVLSWIEPIPVTFVTSRQWKRLDHYLSKRGHHPATITGRFDIVRGSLIEREKDGVHGRGGFGHLGSFSRRLVLHRIDRAE